MNNFFMSVHRVTSVSVAPARILSGSTTISEILIYTDDGDRLVIDLFAARHGDLPVSIQNQGDEA